MWPVFSMKLSIFSCAVLTKQHHYFPTWSSVCVCVCMCVCVYVFCISNYPSKNINLILVHLVNTCVCYNCYVIVMTSLMFLPTICLHTKLCCCTLKTYLVYTHSHTHTHTHKHIQCLKQKNVSKLYFLYLI